MRVACCTVAPLPFSLLPLPNSSFPTLPFFSSCSFLLFSPSPTLFALPSSLYALLSSPSHSLPFPPFPRQIGSACSQPPPTLTSPVQSRSEERGKKKEKRLTVFRSGRQAHTLHLSIARHYSLLSSSLASRHSILSQTSIPQPVTRHTPFSSPGSWVPGKGVLGLYLLEG